MALPSNQVSDRGRSLTPGRATSRGSLGYSSFSVPSRSRSPYYISPDRITRHASPSPNIEITESTEVVPRIPQPYRTSFSAVTCPQRVTRTPSSDRDSRSRSLSPYVRGGTQHASLPYRGSSPAAKLTPADKDSRYLDTTSRWTKCSASAPQNAHVHTSPNFSYVANQSSSSDPNQCAMVNGVEEVDGTTSDEVISNKTSPVHKSLKEGDSTVQHFMSPAKTNGTGSKLAEGSSSRMPGGSPPTTPPEVVIEGAVERKTLIKKEYVHIQSINYFKAVDRNLPRDNSETDKILKDLLKGRHRKESLSAKDNESHKPDSVPVSPDLSPMIREGRSSTMPSDTILRKKTISNNPVKKSLSTSITNFFKRMSPKSLRRLSKGSKGETPGSSTSSLQAEQSFESADNLSQNSDQSGHVPGSNSAATRSRSKSPKASPIRKLLGKKKSKDNMVNSGPNENIPKEMKPNDVITPETKDCVDGIKDTTDRTIHALPSDSARILKSIEENAHAASEKSVYQSFKEKQSPRRVTEGSALKPQALKVVEFPDNILQDSSSKVQDGVHDASQGSNLESPMISSLPATLDRKISASAGKQEDCGQVPCQQKENLQGKAPEPPKTLNVREVAKLSKGMFTFPSMSAESIGQCSLDVYATGSEPSLASRNGQRSSVTASKRTLVSQETTTSSPHKSQATHSPSDMSNHSTSQTGLPPSEATLPNCNTLVETTISEEDTPSKTPSYLKLSCAISGYNKYSSYGTPPEQSRIRVIRHPDSEPSDSHEEVVTTGSEVTGSSSSQDKVTLNGPVVNGRAVDETDSSRPLLRNGALVVTNGLTEEHRSSSHPGTNNVSTTDEDLELLSRQTTRPEPSKAELNTPSPSKDGYYYLRVLDSEVERITQLCEPFEQHLDGSIPEEACGKIRAAVGKAHLLVNKKFNQFRGLCQKNINPEEGEIFQTTAQDLAGFWDMVSLQVEDVNSMFSELEKLRKRNWCEEKNSPARENSAGDPPIRIAAKSAGAGARSKTRVKEGSKSASSTPKSSKSQEAAKAREEARKRLMAAKRAGRQRKASQSDKDEIEILIA